MKKIITLEEIQKLQNEWGSGIVEIGETFQKNGDYTSDAKHFVDKYYGYKEGTVLFKPTKAQKKQFRLNETSAVSYFVGGNPEFEEDKGFALHPWIKVRFENCEHILKEDYAITMGNYFFSDSNGKETKVEYTIGYFRTKVGDIKINLHHSSLPYKN